MLVLSVMTQICMNIENEQNKQKTKQTQNNNSKHYIGLQHYAKIPS